MEDRKLEQLIQAGERLEKQLRRFNDIFGKEQTLRELREEKKRDQALTRASAEACAQQLLGSLKQTKQ